MRSRIHPNHKTKYRVQNWSEYERGLVRRGDVTVWISREAIAAWAPSRERRPGVLVHSSWRATAFPGVDPENLVTVP